MAEMTCKICGKVVTSHDLAYWGSYCSKGCHDAKEPNPKMTEMTAATIVSELRSEIAGFCTENLSDYMQVVRADLLDNASRLIEQQAATIDTHSELAEHYKRMAEQAEVQCDELKKANSELAFAAIEIPPYKATLLEENRRMREALERLVDESERRVWIEKEENRDLPHLARAIDLAQQALKGTDNEKD